MRKTQHRARVLALQALYAKEYTAEPHEEEFAWLDREASSEECAIARALVEGVGAHREEIDRSLAENLENWTLDRLLSVDLAILRLGAYMLKHDKDTPIKVVLDECIELCHSFSGEQSYRLINGMLHNLAQREADAPDASDSPDAQKSPS